MAKHVNELIAEQTAPLEKKIKWYSTMMKKRNKELKLYKKFNQELFDQIEKVNKEIYNCRKTYILTIILLICLIFLIGIQ